MSADQAAELPAALKGSQIRSGLLRLAVFVGIVVALILAVPGLGSIRTRLAHGSPVWIAVAAGLRLASAVSYVVTFRAIFERKMPIRLAYQIAMSEIGLNALVPAGGTGGLAVGGWVLHKRGMSTDDVVQRSAEFFVFTSAFNIGAVAVIGVLGAIGIVPGHRTFLLMLVPAAAAGAIITGAVLVAPRLSKLQADLVRQRAHSVRWWSIEALVLVGTGAGSAGRVFKQRDPRALIGGAGYLFFDIATLWAAVHAFHGHPAISTLAMAYLVGQLAGEIPIPGGIGAVDGGLIGAMVLYGLPAAVATAGALAYRAIALGIPILFGGAAALGLTRTVRGWDAEPDSEPEAVAPAS
jgi:uncharacterized membrane protein YbhN (UPF0104 family)